MKLGVALGAAHPGVHLALTEAAERLGYESVWMPEHLVFPIEMGGSPFPGSDHPPVPPTTPVFDAFGWLCFLAGRTERIRLGTNVYLLGLRHPFVAARAVQTLDFVSNGRAEVGIGAGWLREEWIAAGLDPATRGRRLDEALAVCKRLWSDDVVEHHGAYFDFDRVAFEPKPVQRPWPPIHVGGESDAALRRAVLHGEGWLGLGHTPETVVSLLDRIAAIRAEYELEHEAFAITVGASAPTVAELARFEELGVDRLIVTPWQRTRDAVSGIEAYAALAGLSAD
jgi:probable F420-dependent oxidoreductase